MPASADALVIGGLVCDQWGVPYIDQVMASRRVSPGRRSRKKSEQAGKRLDEIRSLLALGEVPADICRQLSRKWKKKASTVHAYLLVANKLHGNFISDLSSANAQGDSAEYWRKWLVQCEKNVEQLPAIREQLLQETARLVKFNKALMELVPSGQIEADDVGPFLATIAEQLGKVDGIANVLHEASGELRKCIDKAQNASWAVRDRLDRILGAHAPVKKQVESDAVVKITGGLSIDSEPHTKEEAEKEIKGILELLTNRSTGDLN